VIFIKIHVPWRVRVGGKRSCARIVREQESPLDDKDEDFPFDESFSEKARFSKTKKAFKYRGENKRVGEGSRSVSGNFFNRHPGAMAQLPIRNKRGSHAIKIHKEICSPGKIGHRIRGSKERNKREDSEHLPGGGEAARPPIFTCRLERVGGGG